jgi:hypothetical protein
LSDRIEDDVAYFRRAETNPPTPLRVAEIEFPRDAIDTLWPDTSASRILAEPTQSTGAENDPGQVAQRRQAPRRRGPKPIKREAIVHRMTEDIQSGKLSLGDLQDMKEDALATTYGANRDTARKARNEVLASLPPSSGAQETPTNSDKQRP